MNFILRSTFRPSGTIIDLEVSNNFMFIGLSNGQVKRIDLNNPSETDSMLLFFRLNTVVYFLCFQEIKIKKHKEVLYGKI
jgi:hypothetical protein